MKQPSDKAVRAYNEGNAHFRAGDIARAVGHFRRAAREAPDFAPALNNLGYAQISLRDFQQAAYALRRAAALDPENPATQHMLGHALLNLSRAEEALPPLEVAARLAPDNGAIHTDYADALRRVGLLRECLDHSRRAAELEPDRFEVWQNLSHAALDMQQVEEALKASQRALTLAPDVPANRWAHAMNLLKAGRLEEAWPYYEDRWRGFVASDPPFPQPNWDGTPAPGRTLLIHAEQGAGDTIQFSRYVFRAGECARVAFWVQPSLVRLLGSLAGVAEILPNNAPPPAFDLQCPLLSLPGVFGTAAHSVPADIPYLQANSDAVAAWRARLAPHPGRRVGLVWAGGAAYPHDSLRSMAPGLFNVLADIPDVTFVSLQVGARATPQLGLLDWTAELHDFADTAALVSALDLVIGVDTAVIHLAGALGTPVWLLNRFAADWRWGLRGEASAWYPTLRQFRQAAPGDWHGVMARVRAALHSDVSTGVGRT